RPTACVNVTVLPTPLGPRMANVSPFSTPKETPSSTFLPSNVFETSTNSMKAIPYLLIALLLAPLCAASAAPADELVWAADAEGGAPYTFPDPRNPAQIIGF